MGQIEFVGVDGCPCGWFSVGFSQDGRYDVGMFVAFADLLNRYAGSQLILVDMPIGLPGGCEERPSDPKARKKLGQPRGASVFRAPTRQATEYLVNHPGDICGVKAVQMEITGKTLSKQSIAIMPKIAEVDQAMLDRQPKVREVHPEICFWALNNRHPMGFRKKRPEGIEERLCVLERVEPMARDIFNEGCANFYRKDVARDDIIDALAAAVTAGGGWPDGFRTLPQNPPQDARGLRMEMVYWLPRNDALMPEDHPEL